MINKGAFAGCKGLTEIQLPEGLKELHESAFGACSGLTKVKIPYGVEVMHNSFWESDNLEEIDISYGTWCKLTKWYKEQIREKIRIIEISEELTEIEEGAFYGCSGLTEIKIPESVTKIGSEAFYGCSGLTRLVVKPFMAVVD